MSGVPGGAPRGAGHLSVSSEASLAGTFGSKSRSRGPLLCLLSPADDAGEEDTSGENDFTDPLRESVTPSSRRGLLEGSPGEALPMMSSSSYPVTGSVCKRRGDAAQRGAGQLGR